MANPPSPQHQVFVTDPFTSQNHHQHLSSSPNLGLFPTQLYLPASNQFQFNQENNSTNATPQERKNPTPKLVSLYT